MGWMRSRHLRANLAGMRRSILGLPLLDVVLAATLLALKLLILAFGLQEGAGLVSYLIAPAWTLPLAARSRNPIAVALIVTGSAALEAGIGGNHNSIVSLVALVLVHYSLGAHSATVRRLLAGLAPVLAIDVWVALGLEELNLQGLAGVGALVAAAILGGLWVRQLRLRAQALELLALQLEREREERARTAVAVERARIARELHDEVAHAMSVIAVQADAAEGALAHDPALVQRPLVAIRETARSALNDMRRLLGALRDDDLAELLPGPGLARIGSLLEQARSTGLQVDVRIEGEPCPLPPALDLAAYRVLQEGLTNVRKHACARSAEVLIRYELDAIGVEVTDGGASAGEGRPIGSGAGHGLMGIRERVVLLGGEFVAGPRANGFALRVTLPLG